MGKIHDLLKNLNKLGWTRRGNGEHNNTPCHSQRHRCIRRCPHKGGDRPGKKQRTAMAHDWDTETQRRQARQTGGQGVFPETEHQSGGLGTGESHLGKRGGCCRATSKSSWHQPATCTPLSGASKSVRPLFFRIPLNFSWEATPPNKF